MKPPWDRLHSLPVALAAALALSLGCLARGGEGLPDLAGPADTNAPVVAQLRASTQVDGEGVFLDQLFQPGLDLPHLRVGDAPACGKSLLLRRAEISDLARTVGLDDALTNFIGDALRISRRLRPLNEKEALQLLTSVLQPQYAQQQGELELRLTRPWRVVQVPDEPFAVEIQDLPTSGVTPAFIVRFELKTAHGEHVGPWQASVQAKLWREVWVPRSAVKRGEPVRGADLVRERRDLLSCHEALADFSAEDPTLEFVEPVQPGATLLARLVRPRAIVRRGQSLAALLRDGVLVISLKVEALEDGALGQTIRVRNPISRRDLRGRVVDEQNVLVPM